MGKAFDWLARGFGNAIHDIRQQIIENPWFGRTVTPRSQTITLNTERAASDARTPGEQLGWGKPQQQTHDHDMER